MLAHTNGSCYCIADKSLSTSTCAVNKKHLSQILVIRFHDSIINLFLLMVEFFQTQLNLSLKLILIIYELWRGIWVIWVHLRDLPGKIITDLVLICIP